MDVKKALSILIILLLLIGIWGAGDLVLNEIQTENGCPKVWAIPACFIVFLCFLVPLIIHVFNRWYQVYFIFTGLGVTIALVASILQFTSHGECPKLENGIPMCYLSLIIFSILLALKTTLLYKTKHKGELFK